MAVEKATQLFYLKYILHDNVLRGTITRMVLLFSAG